MKIEYSPELLSKHILWTTGILKRISLDRIEETREKFQGYEKPLENQIQGLRGCIEQLAEIVLYQLKYQKNTISEDLPKPTNTVISPSPDYLAETFDSKNRRH